MHERTVGLHKAALVDLDRVEHVSAGKVRELKGVVVLGGNRFGQIDAHTARRHLTVTRNGEVVRGAILCAYFTNTWIIRVLSVEFNLVDGLSDALEASVVVSDSGQDAVLLTLLEGGDHGLVEVAVHDPEKDNS